MLISPMSYVRAAVEAMAGEIAGLLNVKNG
jgi:hypothetical protein